MAHITIRNIGPLTEFKQQTSAFRERLKATGSPEVLTVDGRPDVVVQDADAYQRLLDVVERAETILAVYEGLEDARARRLLPLDTFDQEFSARYGFSRRQ
jgi:PHD/YefM family antitoxin component YafN of YafNO toxin-antitoxin module